MAVTTAGVERTLLLPGWQIRMRAPDWMMEPLAAVLGGVGAIEPLPVVEVNVSGDGRQAEGVTQGRTLWTVPLPPDGWLALLTGQIAATAASLLRRLLYVHAGTVAFGDRAWIIMGASGAGKTSVVTRLVAGGARYLSDDITLLNPAAATAIPFALPLAVKPWTARAAGVLPAGSEVARDEGTRFYLPAATARGPVPVEAFGVMRRDRRASLVPLPRAELLMALAGQPSPLRDPQRLEEAFAGFARVIRGARCYAVSGTPGEAAGLIAAAAGRTAGATTAGT